MIYRGAGFLAVVGFGSKSTPSPPTHPFSKLDWRHTGRLRKKDSLLTGEGAGVEPNHTTARKPGPLEIMQYSLRSTQLHPSSILLLPLSPHSPSRPPAPLCPVPHCLLVLILLLLLFISRPIRPTKTFLGTH
jgi:hypothetical protein